MKSWVTTVIGWLGGLALLYMGYKGGKPEVVVMGLSVMGIGTAAKDFNVTGGTK